MLIRSSWTLTTDTTVSLPKSYGLELSKLLHTQLQIEMGSEATPSTTFSGILGHCRTSKEFVTFSRASSLPALPQRLTGALIQGHRLPRLR